MRAVGGGVAGEAAEGAGSSEDGGGGGGVEVGLVESKHTLDRSVVSILFLSKFAELSRLFELALRARSIPRFPEVYLERGPLEATRAHGRLHRFGVNSEQVRIANSHSDRSVC